MSAGTTTTIGCSHITLVQIMVNNNTVFGLFQREKCLYLKQEFHPAGGLHRPPSGRAPTHSISSDRSSVSSYHDTSGSHPYSQAPLQTQDSLLTLLQPEQRTVVSPPNPPGEQADGHTGGAANTRPWVHVCVTITSSSSQWPR